MIKSILFIALIGAAIASHLGGNRWSLMIQYAGNSCQGEPLVIGALLSSSCAVSTTPTCIIDSGNLLGTSYTLVCVTSLRDYIKTFPANYTAEIVYRGAESNNCTNIQGASYFYVYNMNKCIPTPNGQTDSWRYYDTCDANSMSSQRQCSNTCGGTCQSRTTRTAGCYELNGYTGTYSCNTFNEEILDLVAHGVSPAFMLKPTVGLLALLLAAICW